MGKITGFAHIAITAKDMDKSLDFYTRVLGFKKSFEIKNPKTGAPWINYLYIGNGQFAELFYNGATDNPWKEELRGFNHVSLLVDDIHSVAERIKKEGGVFTSEPVQGCDNNWQAWITDPDGIRIELMQIVEDSPQYRAVQQNER
ncbi:MAG: VOC family protein [Treponema sp.]|jgi:lactoylglutathione lyase|nr:VOC family protein [Treponema sp.]